MTAATLAGLGLKEEQGPRKSQGTSAGHYVKRLENKDWDFSLSVHLCLGTSMDKQQDVTRPKSPDDQIQAVGVKRQ